MKTLAWYEANCPACAESLTRYGMLATKCDTCGRDDSKEAWDAGRGSLQSQEAKERVLREREARGEIMVLRRAPNEGTVLGDEETEQEERS